MSQSLRDWVTDPSQEFPFQLGGTDLQFHYAQTRLMIIFERTIDRFWYTERKVVFRFRPVTESERYTVEKDFWEKKGDERRVALLDELLQKARDDEVRIKQVAD